MNTFYDLNGNQQTDFLFSYEYAFTMQFGCFSGKREEEVISLFWKFESGLFPEYDGYEESYELHMQLLRDMFRKLYYSCAPLEWF